MDGIRIYIYTIMNYQKRDGLLLFRIVIIIKKLTILLHMIVSYRLLWLLVPFFLLLQTNYQQLLLLLLQCEAPKIAKLVQITPITMAYGIYNYSYWVESKPTYILGGPHIVWFFLFYTSLYRWNPWQGSPRSVQTLWILWRSGGAGTSLGWFRPSSSASWGAIFGPMDL